MDQLLGTGQDFSVGWDGLVGGGWRSLDERGNTTWVGTEIGAGLVPSPRVGISGGQGTTVTIPQFYSIFIE